MNFYLDKYFVMTLLPVVSFQHRLTNPRGCCLTVLQMRRFHTAYQHPVSVYKLLEGVPDGIAIATNPGREQKH